MALQIPSGLITGVSGGGVTSGTTQPLYTYPIPVVIVGANGASASGNHSITDTSGVLNVFLNSGAAISVSGDIILVVSGGTLQISGLVTTVSGSLVNLISASGNKISDFSGAINVNISGGNLVANVSGNVVVVATSGTGAGVVIAASGVTALLAESTAQPNLRVAIFNGGSQQGQSTAGISDATTPTNAARTLIDSISIFNGTNFDRLRSVDAISGGKTSGIGILATEILAFDYSGAVHRQIGTSNSGLTSIMANITISGATIDNGPPGDGNTLAGAGIIRVDNTNYVFGGTNWDRMKSVLAVSGGTQSGIGLLATSIMAFDVSGAAHRQITNAGASGSQTVAAGLYYQYSNATGAAITNVQSGAAVLHAVNINAWVSGGQIQIKDSMSGIAGATVATIDFTEVGALATNAFAPQTMIYDCLMRSGLVISTSGAGMDVTVTFKSPP